MEKTRSERLSIVAGVIEQSVVEAAQALDNASQLLLQEKNQLASIEDYYLEYSSHPNKSIQNAEQLSHQSSFLSQIFEAKEQQKDRVQQQQVIVNQLSENWQKLHLQHKAIQEFVRKVVKEENKQLSRKEEKLLDDWFIQVQHLRDGDSSRI